jgi:hypothetical protein
MPLIWFPDSEPERLLYWRRFQLLVEFGAKASDPEVDPYQRYDSEGLDGRRTDMRRRP